MNSAQSATVNTNEQHTLRDDHTCLPLRMEDEERYVDAAVQPRKHGRDKRYLLENALVNHPLPTLHDGWWILPMDAMPSIKKSWYDRLNGAFGMTVRYRVCFVRSPVEVFLTPDTNQANPRHMIFLPSLENNAKHAGFIRNEIFNGTGHNGFVMHANQALNLSISDLTSDEADAQDFKVSNQIQEPKMKS